MLLEAFIQNYKYIKNFLPLLYKFDMLPSFQYSTFIAVNSPPARSLAFPIMPITFSIFFYVESNE